MIVSLSRADYSTIETFLFEFGGTDAEWRELCAAVLAEAASRAMNDGLRYIGICRTEPRLAIQWADIVGIAAEILQQERGLPRVQPIEFAIEGDSLRDPCDRHGLPVDLFWKIADHNAECEAAMFDNHAQSLRQAAKARAGQ